MKRKWLADYDPPVDLTVKQLKEKGLWDDFPESRKKARIAQDKYMLEHLDEKLEQFNNAAKNFGSKAMTRAEFLSLYQ